MAARSGGPEGTPDPRRSVNRPISLNSEREARGLERYEGHAVDGGDGEPPEHSDVRIAKLEVHVSHVQEALSEIRTDIKNLVGNVGHLPTKQDLTTNLAVIVTAVIAVLAIIVGAMGWLETRAARVQPSAQTSTAPIIVQMPTPEPAPTQPKQH